MGKGDRRTRRGKIFAGSHGNARVRAAKAKEPRPVSVLAVAPPSTERGGGVRRQTNTPTESG